MSGVCVFVLEYNPGVIAQLTTNIKRLLGKRPPWLLKQGSSREETLNITHKPSWQTFTQISGFLTVLWIRIWAFWARRIRILYHQKTPVILFLLLYKIV